jgi:hypothetical protein
MREIRILKRPWAQSKVISSTVLLKAHYVYYNFPMKSSCTRVSTVRVIDNPSHSTMPDGTACLPLIACQHDCGFPYY